MPLSQKPRKKTQTAAAKSAGLVALCVRIVSSAPDHPRQDRWENQLATLIEDYLLTGQDAVLAQALYSAVELDPETAAYLERQIEREAALGFAQIQRSGGPQAQGLGAVSLFVVPVLTVVPGGLGAGSRTGYTPEALDELAASFRAFGLVDSAVTIMVMGYLYHPAELTDLSWSQTRALVGTAIDGLQGGRPSAAQLAQSGWPQVRHNQDTPVMEIRYLLVATLTDVTSARVPFQPAAGYSVIPDQKSEDLYAEAVLGWERAAHPLVHKLLNLDERGPPGTRSLWLGMPESLFDGVRAGLTLFRSVGLILDLRRALTAHQLLPAEVTAWAAKYAGPDGLITEVRVSLLAAADKTLIYGGIRELLPFEDPDDVLEDIADQLELTGFDGVSVVDHPVRIEPCPDCGLPTFATPDGLSHPVDSEAAEDPEDTEEGAADRVPPPRVLH
jgi:hypothetical protein